MGLFDAAPKKIRAWVAAIVLVGMSFHVSRAESVFNAWVSHRSQTVMKLFRTTMQAAQPSASEDRSRAKHRPRGGRNGKETVRTKN